MRRRAEPCLWKGRKKGGAHWKCKKVGASYILPSSSSHHCSKELVPSYSSKQYLTEKRSKKKNRSSICEYKDNEAWRNTVAPNGSADFRRHPKKKKYTHLYRRTICYVYITIIKVVTQQEIYWTSWCCIIGVFFLSIDIYILCVQLNCEFHSI